MQTLWLPSSVQNIRYLPEGDSTRVIIQLDSDARYEDARIANPDRIYFDISDAQLSGDFLKRTILVQNEFLKRVRVSQNRQDLVRVVLDISGVAEYAVTELHNPFRIAVQLQGPSGTKSASSLRLKASNSNPEQNFLKTSFSPQPLAAQSVPENPVPLQTSGASAVVSAPQVAEFNPAKLLSPIAGSAGSRAPINDTASVRSVQYLAASGSIRAIIELDSDVRYKEARIADPDRIYFDISNAQLSDDFLNRDIPVKEQVLKRIRVAQNRPDLVRVVFDISMVTNYSVSELHNPFRILLDLHGPAGANVESNFLVESICFESR